MSSGQKLLILGGTGPTGICTVRSALNRGHLVTVYARSPGKLPSEVQKHPNLTIIQGELTDTSLLYHGVAQCDTIISLLGPNSISHKGPIFVPFYSSLLAHIKSLPVASRPRIVALSTISARDPNDNWSLSAYLVVFVVWLLARAAWREFVDSAEVFRKEGDDLEWILFRVALLRNGDRTGRAKAGYIGKGDWSVKMRMEDIADWAVKEAELGKGESQWIGKVPALS